MTPALDAEALDLPAAELGECPLWDDETGTFHWVDIVRGELLSLLRGREAPRVKKLGDRIGSIARRRRGGLLAAVDDSLFLLDADADVEGEIPAPWKGDGSVVNDGACDLGGRFWVGTAGAGGEPLGRLFSYRPDEGWRERLTGIRQSNGIGWSPDGTALYYVDSSLRRLDRFDFRLEDGGLGERLPLISFAGEDEIPDGLTVDRDGSLWVAVFGTGEVRRFDPGGRQTGAVATSASHVTSCAFSGPDLASLRITTGSCELSAEQRAVEPQAGRLFVARPGATGLPEPLFAG